jgi:hypothetical protein
MQEALRIGALGFVVKSDAASDLLPAVSAVMRDQRFVRRRLFPEGSVATFKGKQIIAWVLVCSGYQIEKVVDELNLPRQIISWHPSNLPLPDYVDCFVALNGSPGRLEFSKALFGVHSTFDGSMVLFEDVIQVLHGPVSTTIAQRPFLLTVSDRGAVGQR